MTYSCCFCGRFIGTKEFEENKIIVDHSVEIIDLWGNIKEFTEYYHVSCRKNTE